MSHCVPMNSRQTVTAVKSSVPPCTVPAAAELAGPCSRGGGGGRPGEDVNRAPELARDGGRRGPEDPELLM